MSEDRQLPLDPSGFTFEPSQLEPPGQPPPPAPWYAELPDETNPFAKRLRQQPELGTIGPGERARLDAIDQFYRGTISGSLQLKTLGDVAAGKPAIDPNTGQPHPYLNQETATKELEQIRGDLARYDSLPYFKGPIEGAAAIGGTLAGAALSPESWITGFPGAARAAAWLGRRFAEPAASVVERIMNTAISQGAINVVTDPVAQAGALSTGVDKNYNYWRTGLAFPLGMIFGGVAGAGHEAISALSRTRPLAIPDEVPTPIPTETPRPTEATEVAGVPRETVEQPVEPTQIGAIPATEIEAYKNAGHQDQEITGPLLDYVNRSNLGRETVVYRGMPANEEPGAKNVMSVSPTRTIANDFATKYNPDRDNKLIKITVASDAPAVDITGRDTLKEILLGVGRYTKTGPNEYRFDPYFASAKPPIVSMAPYTGQIVSERAALGAEDPATRVVPNTAAADVERERLQNTAQQSAIAAAAPTEEIQARPRQPITLPEAATYPVEPSETLRSLHQQSFDLAEGLGVPLRQGRVQAREAMGQYDVSQDVIRTGVLADFDTVAHEGGHALERQIGPELTALTQRFAGELDPLSPNPQLPSTSEGFAEWFSHYLTAPAAAQREAPGFYPEFREFMRTKNPELAASFDAAQASYQRWLNAPSTARIDAIVQRQEPNTIGRTLRRDGFAQTVSLMVNRFYQSLFDENAPYTRSVRSIVREAYRASGTRINLPAHADPEKLVRLNSRAVQTAQEAMANGGVDYHASGLGPQAPGLRQVFTTAHGSRTVPERFFGRWNDQVMKDLDSYLAVRQLEIDWRRYDAGDLPNIPAALNRADVAQAIGDLEKAHPTFRQAGEEWTAYTRHLLRKATDAGLLDREVYQRLAQQEFYAPLNRVLDEEPLGAPGVGGPPGQPRATEVIRKKSGSMRDIISPTQSIQAQTFMIERAIADNDVKKAFVALAREARGMGASGVGRIIEEIPPHEIVGKNFDLAEAINAAGRQNGIKPDDLKVILSSVIDVFGEDPVTGSLFRAAPARARGEPIAFYKDGGELRAIRVGDPDLYTLMTSFPPALRDVALNLMAVQSTALRLGVTHNPAWMAFNYVRDQVAASILHPGYVPFNPKGIIRTLRDDGWVHLYGMGGGISPGLAKVGLDQVINRDVDALSRKGYTVQVLGSLRDALPYSGKPQKLQSFGRAIADIAGISEAGTRMNIFERVFRQKKRQGLDDYEAMIEAAYQARDLIDFSRHGSRTMQIRALWTFLNANLQGVDKARRQFVVPLYRAATGGMATRQDVEALKKSGLSWMVGGAGLGALGYAYGLLMGKDEIYQDADPTLRATHLIVPGKKFGLPHDIILIPKPFELAVGFNLGEQAGLAVASGDPRAFKNAMTGVWDVFSPPNILHPITGLTTSTELQLNRSFFTGSDIVRSQEQARPAAQQFRPGTSTLAKQIGAAIGVSPIKVDYAVGGYFGSLGRDIIHAADAFDPNAPDIPPENTMFIRRAIKQADVTSQTTRTFWQLAGQSNGEYVGAKNAYDTAIKERRDKDAMDFLGQLPARQRAYVTLQSAADENGKPAFRADEKNLHPLTRAAKAVALINGMVEQLNVNAQDQIDGGQRLSLNSHERRDAIDGLRQIQAMEERNALVMLGEPAYQNRKILSVEDEFAVLRAKLPAIADELATRYATEHVYKTAEIAKEWPQAQRRLLREGSDADLKDLAADVRSEGPAFEGDRVRRPQRVRRVEIPPLPAGVAAGLTP